MAMQAVVHGEMGHGGGFAGWRAFYRPSGGPGRTHVWWQTGQWADSGFAATAPGTWLSVCLWVSYLMSLGLRCLVCRKEDEDPSLWPLRVVCASSQYGGSKSQNSGSRWSPKAQKQTRASVTSAMSYGQRSHRAGPGSSKGGDIAFTS